MRLGIRRTRGGFTLVELLTVAGVIVVLATLIMSAVFAAQEAGRNATCRNNLSQIHKLMLAYTPNYGGYMPSFWHERWVGEMGLAGGRWREGIIELKKDPRIAPIDEWWHNYEISGDAQKDPPTRKGNPWWNKIHGRIKWLFLNDKSIHNLDDINPLIGRCWDNFQPIQPFVGVAERMIIRSGAPFLLCPSDIANYRCDQGCLVSYMGLAKYGWWHFGTKVPTSPFDGRFEYHQIQEVPKPSRGVMLLETEPATWQFGNCG